MSPRLGRGLVAGLVLAGLAVSATARAQSPAPSPTASPSLAPAPLPTSLSPTSAQPIRDSIDRVVTKMENAREDPCAQAKAAGRPCFPVLTVQKGDEYSVRKSLGVPDADMKKRAPGGAPTVAEMGPYRPGSHTPVAGVSFDPGCVGKTILKSLKGKNDTYYLYRMRDIHGDRVELYDHKVEPSTFQGELAFLGRFDGECAAVAAMRHEELFHPASPAPPMPRPSPSAPPR